MSASDIDELCPSARHPSDTGWILSHCFKIFMMQTGFAVLESSFVRQKNAANIMMKNMADLCFGSLAFWAVGWALAFGVDSDDPENVNGWVGTGHWFLIDASDFGSWMFQLSFATTAATIDSGAVAERMNFKPYLLYTTLLTGVFYPILCHWCWDERGWLSELGFYDFAGSGPVHLLGGMSAAISAWYIGPRHGRFAKTGELEVEVVQGENIGTGEDESGRGGGQQTAPRALYVMVKQLNHGQRVLRTRHSETMAHPRWGALMLFKIQPDHEPKVAPKTWGQYWSTLLGGVDSSEEHSKSGMVEMSQTSDHESQDEHDVGKWVWEVADDELPDAFRDAPHPQQQRVSGNLVHASRAPSHASDGAVEESVGGLSSLRAQLSMNWIGKGGKGAGKGREALAFDAVWCGVGRKGVEFRGKEGKWRRLVPFSHVRNVEMWQLGMQGLTLHLTDLSKIDIKVESAGERDGWMHAILHSWRPALSPIRLRFLVLDHETNQPLGRAELKIVPSDKPDPEKFKLATMLRLSCGGRLEVSATYTSAQRLEREIFQSWDPVKLMFGTFVLWVNWFSFNAGSTYGLVDRGAELASKVSVNTLLAASAGSVFAMFLSNLQTKAFMVEHLSLGVLGSLVAITAPCSVVEPWESIVIGLVGAMVSNLGISLLEHLRIDDPCGAFAVHGAAGLWGVLSVGLFAGPEPCTGVEIRGLFHGGGWRLLGVQLLGVASITAWSAVTCLGMFAAMGWLSRFKWLRWMRLRPSKSTELLGFDQTEHNIHRAHATPVSTYVEDEDEDGRRRRSLVNIQLNVDPVRACGDLLGSDSTPMDNNPQITAVGLSVEEEEAANEDGEESFNVNAC